MSMEHKAFVFDYEAFMAELSYLIEASLATNKVEDLVVFINSNIAFLKDPNDGTVLDYHWQENENLLEIPDAHSYGDIALTKYYDPDCDIGLTYHWQKIEAILANEISVPPEEIILGKQFGFHSNLFDPGKMGSFLQSPEQVQKNAKLLNQIIELKPELDITLVDLYWMLQKALDSRQGLYITF